MFSEIEKIINKCRGKFPGIKLVISEITPRNDGRDTEVKNCNKLLWDYEIIHRHIHCFSRKSTRPFVVDVLR